MMTWQCHVEKSLRRGIMKLFTTHKPLQIVASILLQLTCNNTLRLQPNLERSLVVTWKELFKALRGEQHIHVPVRLIFVVGCDEQMHSSKTRSDCPWRMQRKMALVPTFHGLPWEKNEHDAKAEVSPCLSQAKIWGPKEAYQICLLVCTDCRSS